MEQPLVIQRKKQTAVIALGVILLVAAGGAGIALLTDWAFPQLPGFTHFKVTALVIIVTVVITALYIILRPVFSQKPGLIIDRRGMTDHSNITSVGFIPWREITGIKEAENAFRQKMIIVMVINPNQYIHQTRWLRDTRRMQYRQFGSPIVIAASKLEYDTQELMSLLRKRAGIQSEGGST